MKRASSGSASLHIHPPSFLQLHPDTKVLNATPSTPISEKERSPYLHELEIRIHRDEIFSIQTHCTKSGWLADLRAVARGESVPISGVASIA